MSKINAGVVVVNQFCKNNSKLFSGYINYMERDEAVRSKNTVEFNIYNDYMGNPEKTSGLFTDMKKTLSDQEISSLKQKFETAQKNGSLMWQTVISFDNRWLEEFGLYNSDTKSLNEKKLKELSTNGINKMLCNEHLEHAIWSGAIHYNTDNIHIHIAIVEEYSKREKKLYTQYSYSKNDKNRLIADGVVVDLNGNPVKQEEAKGKFKLKSIELCKQSITNEIIKEKDLNKQINQIIRERINGSFKAKLFQDKELLTKMNDLYNTLPNCNRSLWNYNSSIMKPYHTFIDDISRTYIQNYHLEDFEQLTSMLNTQSALYRTAYGDSKSHNEFQETKLKDLYSRMGNSILKSIRNMDQELSSEQNFKSNFSEMYLKDIEKIISDSSKSPDENKSYNLYKLGIMHYKGIHANKDINAAIRYLEESSKLGNENAKYHLGVIYTTSGTPTYNIQKGITLLEEARSTGNLFASCRLGDIYNFQFKDMGKASSYYKEASDNGSMYAQNQLVKITFSNMNQNIRKNFHFEKALQYMKQSLKKDYEAWKNIFEHDQELQNSIQRSMSDYDF